MKVKFRPTSYWVYHASSIAITNATQMLRFVDSEDYSTIRIFGTGSSWVHVNGFSITGIPENSVVTAITIKVKGRGDNLKVSGSGKTTVGLAILNGINVTNIADTISSEDFENGTTTIITVPTGGLTLSQIISYGNRFGIIFRPNKNSSSDGYLYLYGMQIEITYYPNMKGRYIKRFHTEQEYQDFYDDLKEAIDGGEPFEDPLVCLVDNNDPTTPDTLTLRNPDNIFPAIPDFHYNANDNLHYIVGINPTWLMYGYLSDTMHLADFGDFEAVNFVRTNNKVLNDVIDGLQIEGLSTNFYSGADGNMGEMLPNFNVGNVKYMYLHHSYRFPMNVFPSLIYIRAEHFYRDYPATRIFEDGICYTPELIKWLTHNNGTGNGDRSNMITFVCPKLQQIGSVTLTFTSGIIDINDIWRDCEDTLTYVEMYPVAEGFSLVTNTDVTWAGGCSIGGSNGFYLKLGGTTVRPTGARKYLKGNLDLSTYDVPATFTGSPGNPFFWLQDSYSESLVDKTIGRVTFNKDSISIYQYTYMESSSMISLYNTNLFKNVTIKKRFTNAAQNDVFPSIVDVACENLTLDVTEYGDEGAVSNTLSIPPLNHSLNAVIRVHSSGYRNGLHIACNSASTYKYVFSETVLRYGFFWLGGEGLRDFVAPSVSPVTQIRTACLIYPNRYIFNNFDLYLMYIHCDAGILTINEYYNKFEYNINTDADVPYGGNSEVGFSSGNKLKELQFTDNCVISSFSMPLGSHMHWQHDDVNHFYKYPSISFGDNTSSAVINLVLNNLDYAYLEARRQADPTYNFKFTSLRIARAEWDALTQTQRDNVDTYFIDKYLVGSVTP